MQLSISFQLTSTLETCLGLNTCLIGIIQTVLRSARLQINVQRPHPKVLTPGPHQEVQLAVPTQLHFTPGAEAQVMLPSAGESQEKCQPFVFPTRAVH